MQKVQRYEKTAAQWTALNTILPAGWEGVESDTGRYKQGDGRTAWASLPYAGGLATTDRNLALEFTAANIGHVNHGQFWQANVVYKEFWADFLIKPTGDGYVLSAGYGGNHCLLFGTSGVVNGGHTITGNIFNATGSVLTSFTTTDSLRTNEWAYVAVAYDGAYVTVIINGVPSSIVAYTGDRETDLAIEGTLLIGGSNHNMWSGRCGGVRIFESTPAVFYGGGNSPHDLVIYPPVHSFGATSYLGSGGQVQSNFAADYRTGSLQDNSLGLSGRNHNGFLAEANGDVTGLSGSLNDPLPYNRTPSKLPTWVIDPFTFSGAAVTKTPIASSRIYDGFGGADVHYGISATLGLGTTEVGSKVWDASDYGILNGNVFVKQTSSGNALITDVTADGTTILRRPSATTVLSGSASYLFYLRYTDANNYTRLQVANNGGWGVYEIVGGVGGYITAAGYDFTFGTTWTELKAVANGTSIGIYRDGALVETVTSAFTAGLKKGFNLTQPVLRVSEFAVI